MTKKLIGLACVLGFSLVSSMAFAQTGSEGVFTIHNDTTNNVVTGFYTNDGTGWSSNWLSQNLEPEQSAEARFAEDTGSCEQTFQVGWLGENNSEVLDEPVDIDICEASNVYLEDNDISFD